MTIIDSLDLPAEKCRGHEVTIWFYCLMPNHSHLVPVPVTEAGLAAEYPCNYPYCNACSTRSL